jgi:multidrug resistance efflux pump
MTVEELEVKVAQAKLDAAKAKADRATKEWERARLLRPKEAISGTDYDQAECNNKVAQAEVEEAAAKLDIAKLKAGKPIAAASPKGSRKSR